MWLMAHPWSAVSKWLQAEPAETISSLVSTTSGPRETVSYEWPRLSAQIAESKVNSRLRAAFPSV